MQREEITMLTTTAAGRTFDYSYCIGMVAMSGAGLTFPVDFALGANGVVYVINRAAEGLNQRVTKCTVDHEFVARRWPRRVWHAARRFHRPAPSRNR